jgi:16S rRNA (guanine527-N7)-methyltransferase
LDSLDLEATQSQLNQFRAYHEEVVKWNRAVGLIAKGDESRFITHHVLPSVALLRFLPGGVRELADVGSGAGLPGIPLKIMKPALKVALIEAKLRKSVFLKEVVRKLSLVDIEVVNRRAEEIQWNYPVAVTRALGTLRKAVKICLPLVRVDGIVIVVGARREEGELKEAISWLGGHGGRLMEIKEVVSPITKKRGSLVYVSKVSRET